VPAAVAVGVDLPLRHADGRSLCHVGRSRRRLGLASPEQGGGGGGGRAIVVAREGAGFLDRLLAWATVKGYLETRDIPRYPVTGVSPPWDSSRP
jgi:hypothetical protein